MEMGDIVSVIGSDIVGPIISTTYNKGTRSLEHLIQSPAPEHDETIKGVLVKGEHRRWLAEAKLKVVKTRAEVEAATQETGSHE